MDNGTQALGASYEESVTVYRFTDVATDGISTAVPQAVYRNIPCGYSRWTDKWRRSGKGALESSHQSIYYGALLFLDVQWQILPGDLVEVTQLGVTTTYQVMGESTRYPTHQEVFLAKRDVS